MPIITIKEGLICCDGKCCCGGTNFENSENIKETFDCGSCDSYIKNPKLVIRGNEQSLTRWVK